MAKNNTNPFASNVTIKNKRASFEFEFIETYTCGMVLKGSEIKSLRLGKGSLTESYCFMDNSELFLKNMNIAKYEFGAYSNHEPTRLRKLLLKKKEIAKIEKKLIDIGTTIVPLRLFTSERGLMKLEIAVARGKKIHDKRNSIKDRDVQRDLDRKE